MRAALQGEHEVRPYRTDRVRAAGLVIACCLVALGFAQPGGGEAAEGGATMIRNPSFEEGGTEIKGVGYVRQGNALPGWDALGDGECARNTRGLAFFDNGVAPDGEVIAILQNRSVLRQEVGPCAPGKVYRLRVRANGRASDAASCGRHGRLEVRLNGTTLIGPVEVKPVEAAGKHTAPFHAFEAIFHTAGGAYPLELAQTDGADGISVLVDDVRIEPADTPAGQSIRVNRARPRSPSLPVPGMDFRKTQWIWSPEETPPSPAGGVGNLPVGMRFFRRTFEAPAGLKRALMVASADNSADVFVNGEWCGTAPGFGAWYDIELGDFLRPGRNTVAVRATNAGDQPNPAGFAGAILLLGEGDRPLLALPTDARWRCSRTAPDGWMEPAFNDAAWQPAARLGEVGCAPWGNFGFLTWLVPDDFPQFDVPGQEKRMELARQLFWLHYPGAGPKATMWDPWLSMSSLWPATGPGAGSNGHREAWRRELLRRRMDYEGYVSTIQHHGFGHGEGWPFPTCHQAGGIGWQFGSAHTAYRVRPVRSLAGWETNGLEQTDLDETRGLSLRVTADAASLTSPAFDVDHFVSPFVRLEWHPDFPKDASATLEWATKEHPEFDPARSLPLRPEPDVPGGTYTHVPLYRHPEWKGRLTRFRLSFRSARGASLRVLGLITANDTRHPINNPCYLQGCTEYFNWTGDLEFLRANLGRMRTALAYALKEFQVEEQGCVFVPWVGHDGRTGLTRKPDGSKEIHHGRGVGANYWDLLPFSGRDCLATIYLYDALRRMATLEREIAARKEWKLPAAEAGLSAQRLEEIAAKIRERAGKTFWNAETGRFAACIDSDGVAHDYGYTFVNCEAVYYGLATPVQARSIIDWLDGRRTVAGDTATGDDIYHFRFGPRASTRRNVEWYSFVWQAPESIPWGNQVQDGGAVLGFTFHDQMARLMTAGPDNCWTATRRTLDWFGDIREAGGYRAYYAVPGRGTLQGGGPPGGLGLDCEFFESALAPQILLYGYLGLRAEPGGLRLDPRLPAEWPELRVSRIHFRDVVLEITATRDRLRIASRGEKTSRVRLALPAGWKLERQPGMGAPVATDGDTSTEVTLGAGRILMARREK